MAVITAHAAAHQPVGVIWLPTASAVHTMSPRTTRDFLAAVGNSSVGDGWQVFDTSDAIRAMPEKDRPADWVILLDPHAEFRDATRLMNELDCRVPELLARQAGDGTWRATVAMCSPLFASYPTPTPPPSGPAAESFRKAEPSFRRNEFYAHVLAGYQWGEVVRADRLAAFLARVVHNRHLLRLTDTELLAWRGDVKRLWDALTAELGKWGLHSNYFDGLKDRPDRFLDTLARIDRLGRWKKEQAEAFLRGVDADEQHDGVDADEQHDIGPRTQAESTGVAWLDRTPGAFALKENLDELHDEAWKDLQKNGGVPMHGPKKDDVAVIRQLIPNLVDQ